MYNNLPNIDAVRTGNRIAQLRQERQLSRREVQEFFGFSSQQAVYKWEKGRSVPSADNLVALSWLFQTTIEDIIRTDRERGEVERTSPLPFIRGLNLWFIDGNLCAYYNANVI